MIIYNVTVQVGLQVAAKWLLWMQQEHIPAVMATRCFETYRLVKLLGTDETEGLTYAVQYFAANLEQCETYLEQYAPALRQEVAETWGEQVFSFRTLMEVIA
jgi:Domain of unknown function (DUF4286)